MSTPGPGQLLFSFVRHWSRRAMTGEQTLADQGRLVLTTEAVAAIVDRGASATVNAVAYEIGIDQSGASRLIKSAVEAGYVAMVTASADARRREATVTSQGRNTLRQARDWQEKLFAELTEGWSQTRRDEFRDAMTDLLATSYTRD